MAYATPIVVQASAAQTTSGVGAALDLGIGVNAALGLTLGVKLHLDVTAISGTATPTLVASIETSRDLVTWVTLATLPNVVAAGVPGSLDIAGIAKRYIRVRWTITGTTPSFTFSVSGDATQVFIDPTDLADFGLSTESLTNLDTSRIARILIGASVIAATDLQSSGRVVLPLVSWGPDLTMAIAKLAAWEIMTTVIGHNPEDPNNFVWMNRAKEGRDWLESVARGLRTPVGLVDASPTVEETGTEIYTEPKRGW